MSLTHPAAAMGRACGLGLGSEADFEVNAAIATTVKSANLPIAISPVELNLLTVKADSAPALIYEL